MTEQQHVLAALQRERQYQDAKWGTIEQNPHPVRAWLHIAQEEMSEAFLEYTDEDTTGALYELLQAAAVIVACLEQYGIVERAGAVPAPDVDYS